MLSILYPDFYLDSVFEVDYCGLKKSGINLLLFDIDNTLMPFDIKHPAKEVINLISYVRGLGFKVILISNNYPKRVSLFNRELNVPILPNAKKPLPFWVKKAVRAQNMELSETAIIGDQVFTDVLCGNILKIVTILVKPISERDEFIVKMKRGAERLVNKRYLKKTGK